MNTKSLNQVLSPQRDKNSWLDKKRKLLVMLGVCIFLLIPLFGFFYSRTAPREQSPQPTPNSSVSAIPTPIVEVSKPLSANEQTVIITQIKSALQQRTPLDYTVAQTKLYGKNWALVQITNQTTDPAIVVVKQEATGWIITNGPGTNFAEDELRAEGAPESLIQEVNKGF